MALRRLLSALLAFSFAGPVFAADKPVVLISGLSETSIVDLGYLLDHDLLPLKNKVAFIAIYHKSDITSLSEAEKVASTIKQPFFTIEHFDCQISPEGLFRRNDCTGVFEKLFDRSSGVIFLGGYDLPAKTYTDKVSTFTVSKTPERSYFELSFLSHLLGGSRDDRLAQYDRPAVLLDRNPEYCVFGICLGMQSMNVADGGSLVQDIPFDLYGLTVVNEILKLDPSLLHRNYLVNLDPELSMESGTLHPVAIKKTGLFASLFRTKETDRPLVLSNHHQAIGTIGPDYTVIANSIDGKVGEAIQHKRYPNVFGVQFHPEKKRLYDQSETISLDGTHSKENKLSTTFRKNRVNIVFAEDLLVEVARRLESGKKQ